MAEHNIEVGIMVSGSATTMEAFCLTVAERGLPIEVPTVICDRTDKPALRVVERLNGVLDWDMKPVLVDKGTYPDGPGERSWDITDQQSELMAREFDGCDVVSQQGFASRVRGALLEERGSLPGHTSTYQASLINNHPGLLPYTKGLYGSNVHKKAASTTTNTTGLTVHTVSENYDEGFTISVDRIAMLPSDEWQDYERMVQALEKVRTPTRILGFAALRREYLASRAGS